jgi:hypothetical protein
MAFGLTVSAVLPATSLFSPSPSFEPLRHLHFAVTQLQKKNVSVFCPSQASGFLA